ncbi:MAG TPA: type I-C CRISPR-associated protein Cas8c/Csd1 [Geobacteraceae bacterium]|nr:type I-C CRISPR-associated protein Cas8c/Csd1 [Geobacteraceae bacterium]
MILQGLKDYYDRLQTEGIADVATEGFQKQAIPFVVVVDHEGRFLGLTDTRSGDGRTRVARYFTVPQAVKKTSGVAANLLWDVPGYVFGRPRPDPKKDPARLVERAVEQKRRFIAVIREKLALVLEDAGVSAVLRLLERGDFGAVFEHPFWSEIEQSGANLGFQLEGDTCLVCERPAVVAALRSAGMTPGSGRQACLVTGEPDESARLHTAIKGVYGAQTSGANIVSFNLPAFLSFGKQQSFNAPVGKRAEFAYTTALNHLLSKGAGRRLQVGDASTVFWAEKKHEIEGVFADLFGEPPKGEPEQDYRQLLATFRAPEAGVPPQLDPKTRFFVLGLAPNAARIAVRFWYAGSVGEVARSIGQHFEDIEMVRAPHHPAHLSLFRLLVSTAALGKAENIPANLAGEFMRAILAGTPYPQAVLGTAIRRCRAEREITYPRASLIKAILARNSRYYKQAEKEVGMSLDTTIGNVGYRLGRLFATLEKIQEEASPGINATIRDRFYGAASATPVAAFPHLMKLKNHHLAKLENRGRVVNFERTIGEIMEELTAFPAHLSLPDQGRFAVGYYHQRQAFFTSSKKEQ